MAVFKKFLSKLFILLALVCPFQALAQIKQIPLQDALEKTVASIAIEGLQRTRKSVVQRELLIREGEVLRQSELQESLQRLRNLRLFHEVVDEYYLDEQGQVHVHLQFSEAFTTIPILKVTKGGGTTYFVLGVYDVNVFGKYLEAGAQYESWDGEDGGVVWFRNPRFLGGRIRFGADLWSINRPRDLYEPDGTSQGSFVLDQNKLNVFIDKEWRREFTLGAGVEFDENSVRDGNMPEQLSVGVSDALASQTDTSNVWAKVYLKLGQLNYDKALLEGKSSELNLDYSSPALGSDNEAFRINWDNKAFWRLGKNSNIGWRLRWAKTNSNELQYLYYVGGFENVRGYFDGQLRGKQFWQSNLEYRNILLERNWYFLQAVVFGDVAQLIDATDPIESNTDDIFSSFGVGLRLGSPRIYRFTARLDIALATSHPATSRISFGVQQFF